MTRVIIETPCILPAFLGDYGDSHPAVPLTRGMVLEATPAMLTAITAAGGTTRAVTGTTMRDQLGESSAASNASP